MDCISNFILTSGLPSAWSSKKRKLPAPRRRWLNHQNLAVSFALPMPLLIQKPMLPHQHARGPTRSTALLRPLVHSAFAKSHFRSTLKPHRASCFSVSACTVVHSRAARLSDQKLSSGSWTWRVIASSCVARLLEGCRIIPQPARFRFTGKTGFSGQWWSGRFGWLCWYVFLSNDKNWCELEFLVTQILTFLRYTY